MKQYAAIYHFTPWLNTVAPKIRLAMYLNIKAAGILEFITIANIASMVPVSNPASKIQDSVFFPRVCSIMISGSYNFNNPQIS
jgi:hypothetical protein